jgi:hypothetical protein
VEETVETPIAPELQAAVDEAIGRVEARTRKAAATRAATLAREAEAEKAVLKSNTCPNCFQLRAASGVCGCD